MKDIKEFKIGSSYFFSCYPDYIQKDIDSLVIMDNFLHIYDGKTSFLMRPKNMKEDILIYKNLTKEEYLEEFFNNETDIIKIGKFLIPEFCEYIGFTIEDLKQLEHYFYCLDEKHMYQRIIYEFYISNNNFTLDDNQREIVYQEYKKVRPEYSEEN